MIGAIASHYVAAASSSYATEVLADSPLGYWRLGDTSGAMADASGNGRNGTYTNVTLAQPGLLAGDVDTAANFSGTNSYAVVADAAWMDVAAITVEAWIKPDSVSGTPNIVSRRKDATNSVFSFRLSGAKLNWFGWRGGASTGQSGATALVAGQVYHVVGTKDAGGWKVYLNGALDGSSAADPSALDARAVGISIGRDELNGFHFDGVIDEVAFYDYALSGARVAAHYNAGI